MASPFGPCFIFPGQAASRIQQHGDLWVVDTQKMQYALQGWLRVRQQVLEGHAMDLLVWIKLAKF